MVIGACKINESASIDFENSEHIVVGSVLMVSLLYLGQRASYLFIRVVKLLKPKLVPSLSQSCRIQDRVAKFTHLDWKGNWFINWDGIKKYHWKSNQNPFIIVYSSLKTCKGENFIIMDLLVVYLKKLLLLWPY